MIPIRGRDREMVNFRIRPLIGRRTYRIIYFLKKEKALNIQKPLGTNKHLILAG